MKNSAARGYLRRQERLPLQRAQITAAWLTRTLRNRYPGISIDSMRELETVGGPSNKMRVAISASGAGAEQIARQLCLKSNWTGIATVNPANVNEARFYRQLARELAIPAVTCFYADWDDDEHGQQGLLVLDDLQTWGGEFGTTTRPIGIADAMKSIEALAELHGTTWGSPLLERAAWLQTSMAPETVVDDYWVLMGEYTDLVNRRAERLAILPQWAARDPLNMRRAWLQLRDHDLSRPGPRCLVHGDVHLGNTYRMPDGTRLLYDWQIVRKGHPWRDYTYFVVGSMTVADRRGAERQLLEHYLARLAKHGVSLDPDAAWDDYRRWVIWGLVSWHVAGDHNVVEDTMVTLERFCTAARDFRVDEMFQF